MIEFIAPHQSFMELLKFKCGYSFWWLLKVYKFFVLDNIPSLLMVPIASYYMEGEVLKWFQGMEASSLYTNWVDFICTHNISFEHQSFLHQWRLPPKNPNARARELHDGEPRTNPWCTHSRVHNSRIRNPSVFDPRIKDVKADNSNGSRITWGIENSKPIQGPNN